MLSFYLSIVVNCMMTALLRTAFFPADGPAQFVENTDIANRGHATAQPDGHNLMGNQGDDF
jgi:hypothetical protein